MQVQETLTTLIHEKDEIIAALKAEIERLKQQLTELGQSLATQTESLTRQLAQAHAEALTHKKTIAELQIAIAGTNAKT